MSSFPTYSGEAPRSGRASARNGDAWEVQAHPDADDYPFTVQQLRTHLERLGYRARTGGVGGENVREMQARVAELRASLAQGSARDRHTHEPRRAANPAGHEAQTRYYERRIQAALADMAAQLRGGPQEAEHAPGSPAGLDVASRAWLDQRFAAMRGRLEGALAKTEPPAREDICAALEEARKRLSAMERKIEHAAERQHETTAKILDLISQESGSQSGSDPLLARLDERLQSLQDNFDRAMGELEAMKAGTQRLAIRASATIARQTARATAQHVAGAVREAAPERRFARLDESITGCMKETRMLHQKTGAMQQTLEHGLEDLRGRVNELTLITRKALATAAPAHAGAMLDAPAAAARAGGWPAPAAPQPVRRTPALPAAVRTAPWWQAPAHEAEAAPSAFGGSLVSRIGFALVIVLMIAASFAMLYAQLSRKDGGLAPAPYGVAPTSATPDRLSTRRPITIEDGGPGSVILPGIILTGGAQGPV